MGLIITAIKRRGILNTFLLCIGTVPFLLVEPIARLLNKYRKVDKDLYVFISYPSFSDNSRVFFEYLRDTCANRKLVWLIGNDNASVDDLKGIEYCYFFSKYHLGLTFKSLKILSTASLIFYTHGNPDARMKKKEQQHIINLWHGCGYKSNKSNKSKNKNLDFDIGLVPGAAFVPIKARLWQCNEEKVVPLGYPRYDIFNSGCKLTSIKTRQGTFQFEEYNTVIAWLPTFRQSIIYNYAEYKLITTTGLPLLESYSDIDRINEKLMQTKTLLIVKRHPSQKKYACEEKHYSNICFLSNEDLVESKIELYNMLTVCDSLITDYSSVGIDFLLLDKPIAYTLSDEEQYGEVRGFVFENVEEYMPGHKILTVHDFEMFIGEISRKEDRYKDQRNRVKNILLNPCDNYCKRLYEYLVERGFIES